VASWSVLEKQMAVEAVLAKAGRHEIEFARRVAAHAPLTLALQRLLQGARAAA
jgi:hypothetical protein